MKILVVCALAAASFTTGATGHSTIGTTERLSFTQHANAQAFRAATVSNLPRIIHSSGSFREPYDSYIAPLPPI